MIPIVKFNRIQEFRYFLGAYFYAISVNLSMSFDFFFTLIGIRNYRQQNFVIVTVIFYFLVA